MQRSFLLPCILHYSPRHEVRRSVTRILTPSDYRRMPWKNRLGVTTEVARYPDEFGSLFDWRVSIADVMNDGPFSQFTGYDRIIVVIGGEGMTLTHPQAAEPVK